MKNSNTNNQNQTTELNHSSIPTMIPLKKVVHHTGLSSTTIYNMLDKKSNRYDPTFPTQVKLSKGRVAWVESEIKDWLESKIATRDY